MTDWTLWANAVGQLIQAIAKAAGEPVDEVRRRLLADPRVNGTATDDAAALIEHSMPVLPDSPTEPTNR